MASSMLSIVTVLLHVSLSTFTVIEVFFLDRLDDLIGDTQWLPPIKFYARFCGNLVEDVDKQTPQKIVMIHPPVDVALWENRVPWTLGYIALIPIN